ncbi:MAG: LytTR family DNA-binding domain-containing protein [Niabella sp.]
MTLNCVIVDDEPLAREILSGFMAPLPRINLVGAFGNAFDALQYLKQYPVDVLFLDIEMPGMSGINLLKSLAQPPLTIFTTAFRNYAFEGFELGVIDFLLKPISEQRFNQSIEKITDFLALQQKGTNIEMSRENTGFIFVKSGVERIKLFLSEVIFIQGLKDYAIIQTTTDKIVVKGSVKFMQELFPEPAFIRVHKSFIVAKHRVRKITRNQLMLGKHDIPIGRVYGDDLEKKIRQM